MQIYINARTVYGNCEGLEAKAHEKLLKKLKISIVRFQVSITRDFE